MAKIQTQVMVPVLIQGHFQSRSVEVGLRSSDLALLEIKLDPSYEESLIDLKRNFDAWVQCNSTEKVDMQEYLAEAALHSLQ